jgi:TolB-like protein
VIFFFGECSLDTERREFRRNQLLYLLEPQVFDLLEYLIRNRDRVVSRNELLEAIWHGRIVSDAALDTRLSAARKAIGDNGIAQKFIRTLRTKGVHFVAPVHEELPQRKATNGGPGGDRAAPLDDPSIAVVPLVVIGDGPQLEVLADGITDDLAMSLAKVPWLLVAPRPSRSAWKAEIVDGAELAAKLGVRYLLTGGVRRTADRIRITLQLVDAVAHQQIWTERFDQDVVDALPFYDEICERVMAVLEPQLYAAEHIRVQRKSAKDLNGWESVLRALSLMNSRREQDIAAATAILKSAIALNPESAAHHSLLSIATTLRVHMSWADRQAVLPDALASARKAMSLGPEEPWAHTALGYALIWKHPEEAIASCQRAIELNPMLGTAHYFLALAATYAGLRDEVFSHAEQAESLAKRDLLARGFSGAHDNVRATACFALERYQEGAGFAQRAMNYLPNSPTAYRALIINQVLGGKSDDAKEALRTLREVAPKMSLSWVRQNSVWAAPQTSKRYFEAWRMVGL